MDVLARRCNRTRTAGKVIGRPIAVAYPRGCWRIQWGVRASLMRFLDFLQSLPLPVLLGATLCLALVLSSTILAAVRFSVRLSGVDPAKPLPIHDLVPVTSIFFALMVAFSASGIWNDWLQARNAVEREALALENVMALAQGLSADQAAKVKERVAAYAKAAGEHEWPAMARQAGIGRALCDLRSHSRRPDRRVVERRRQAECFGNSQIGRA